MSRQKEFDPAVAAQEAMEAFWERGYAGTSVNDLLVETGLNRGSLYDTFGDKRTLFLTALERYEAQGRAQLVALLERPGSAHAAITEWFGQIVDRVTGKNGARACLAIKAALEVAPFDPDVARWVKQLWQRNHKLLSATIARGQHQGDIARAINPETTAGYLMTFVSGMHVLGTMTPDPALVEKSAAMALDALTPR